MHGRWREAYERSDTLPGWGRLYDRIDATLAGWLRRQPVFFVATAPAAGHLNLSPKGLDTFRVLAPDTVAYLDLTGSGVETIAHLRENGRIVLMFCAFSGPVRIVRLWGEGVPILPEDDRFADLAAGFATFPATRAVIQVGVERIADSCGYGVPEMQLVGERTLLPEWAERRGAAGIAAYKAEKNARSIDGLPGLVSTEAPSASGAQESLF